MFDGQAAKACRREQVINSRTQVQLKSGGFHRAAKARASKVLQKALTLIRVEGIGLGLDAQQRAIGRPVARFEMSNKVKQAG
jgi:hypothetical protein